MKWSAIRNGRIHIEHTVVRVRSLISKDRTKTPESNRELMIIPRIQNLLDAVKRLQDENRLLYGDSYVENDYIFTWPNGKPISPDYVTKHFKKIIKRIPQLDNSLRLHDLRASCISILLREGCSLKDVQAFVGHKDIQTTLEIYARTNEKRQLEVANAMDRVLFPQPIQEKSVKSR